MKSTKLNPIALVFIASTGSILFGGGSYPSQSVPATPGEDMTMVMRALDLVEKTFLAYVADTPLKGDEFDFTRDVQVTFLNP
jgi:hypothetical protein